MYYSVSVEFLALDEYEKKQKQMRAYHLHSLTYYKTPCVSNIYR
jgi:hypothetical protein